MRAEPSERRGLSAQFFSRARHLLSFASLALAINCTQAAEKPTTGTTIPGSTRVEAAAIKLSETNQAKIAAMRRAGEPTTLAELNAWYPTPPPEQNAWLIYSNAFAALSAVEPKVPAFLPSNQKALAWLHQAAARPQCRYPVDLTQGGFALLPHLERIKRSAELLQNEMVVAAASGQSEQAVKSGIAVMALARSLEQEPIVISQLVRVRIIEYATTGLESTLNRKVLTDEQTLRMLACLQSAEKINDIAVARSLVGERCSGLSVFQSPSQASGLFRQAESQSDSPHDADFANLIGNHVKTAAGQKDLEFYLNHLESLIAAVKKPGTRSLDLARNWSEELAEVKKTNVFAFPLSEALLPALATLPQKSDTTLANLRIAEAALAIERFRLAHGNKTPTSLSELVPQYLPAVPVDPFSDAPLRYRPNSPRGYTVYSVGPDQQDDGGTHKPLKVLKNSIYDLAFTVQR